MEQKYDKYLPIGSVVLLENANKRVMITGFCVTPNDGKSPMYDYIACLYPEGVLNTEKNLLFNHEQIKQIYAIGYSDDEEKKFKQLLKENINK